MGDIVVRVYREKNGQRDQSENSDSAFQDSDFTKKIHSKALVKEAKSHGVV